MDKAQEREISRLQQEIAAIRERLDRSYDALVSLIAEAEVDFASDAETQAGTIDNKAVTPESLHADGPATPAASRLVRLNSSGNMVLPGKIGINTGSTIVGQIQAKAPTGSAAQIRVTNPEGKDVDIVCYRNGDTASIFGISPRGGIGTVATNSDRLIIGTNTAAKMYIGANSSIAITVDTSQQVGIGTQSPAARLDIDNGAMRFEEMTAPAAPAANSVVVFARDDGAGKTELCARFNTGAIQVIAAQP